MDWLGGQTGGRGGGALPDVVGVCYYCSHFQLGSHAETSPFYY